MGSALKIFGVGWPKTGTSTLRQCFIILGYTHKGYSEDLFDNVYQATRAAARFETFQDLPWYLYYKELDQDYPGSKFVLTIRDSNRWVSSYRNALAKQEPSLRRALDETRRKIYGVPFPDVKDEQLIERYERHNTEVRLYFRDRPDDLLIVDWEKGDGWKQLCSFMKREAPRRAFPHANKGNYR